MTYPEYYDSILALERRIKTLGVRIERLCEHAGVKSPSLSGMPAPPNRDHSAMADAMDKAMDLKKELEETKDLLLRKQMFLEDLIYSHDTGSDATVFIKRFIDHKKVADLCEEYSTASRSLYRDLETIRAALENDFRALSADGLP